jgi:integrase
MSLKKRGKYWHYEFMLDGERYWGTTRETAKSRAQTFESLRIADIRRHNVNPRVRRAPVLSEFAEEFLRYIDARTDARTLGKKMKDQYHCGWKLLQMTTIKDMRIDQITRSAASVLTFRGGAWNARSAQKTLKRMLNHAAELGIIQAAPRITLTKAYGRSALIDSKTETALLEHMSLDMGAIFTIMMDSGQRPDEVMRMEWSNVHFDRQVIFIPSGKTTNSRRFVPLSERVTAILRQRQTDAQAKIAKLNDRFAKKKITAASRDSRTRSIQQWVFPGKTAEGRRNSLFKQFNQARDAAGVHPGIVLYCARHTFATNLLAETGDLALVQRVLGHESITTTQKYLHPETSGVADVVNKRNQRTQLQLVA